MEITVAPQVEEWGSGIELFQAYMEGKRYSRSAVITSFDKRSTLIEPTFIYGGDAFGINPPRVASFYGQFIEALLASAPVRAVEGVLPPGFIKIALEPPVSVDAVARAAIVGVLKKDAPAVLDTYDSIREAAELL